MDNEKEYRRGEINGYVYILPAMEKPLRGIKKGFGMGWFWSSDFSGFGLSIQFLKHGVIFQVGPFYMGWVHIKKQREHWDN